MSYVGKSVKKWVTLHGLLLGSLTVSIYGSDDIQTWFLDDGTEVLLLEDYRAPLVSIEINFNVNRLMPWSVDNSAHAAFACQMFDSDRRIQREIENSGVFISASMGWGRARIGGSSLAVEFPKLVGLIREVLENRDYSRKEMQKWQRDRIISWRSSTTNPRTILNQAAIKLLYPNEQDPRNALYDQPLSFTRSAEKLARVRDTVLSTPIRNIAVSGSIDKEGLQKLIKNLLPKTRVSSEFSDSNDRPVEFINAEPKTIELKNLTQVYMALIRDSLPFNHEDYPAYLVVNQILGGTFNSRLYQTLRHETGDTYSATLSSSFTTATRPGMLRLQTYTRVDNATETERRLRSVLAAVHVDGVSKEEVETALAYLNGRLVFSKETPDQIVNRAAINKVANLPSNHRELTLARAAEMSLVEINTFIRRYYDPTKFALVKVVPESS
ncbi:MAG: insulinase family protein [Gammaproteobacteria bacterium]|nr:insulinase family protein [Gammaproteobacteria bacterium]